MDGIAPQDGRLTLREAVGLLAAWGDLDDLVRFLNDWVDAGLLPIDHDVAEAWTPAALRDAMLQEPWACQAVRPLIEALVLRYSEWRERYLEE